MRMLYLLFKAICDRVIAAIGIIILSPLFLVAVLMVASDGQGNIIFRQPRIGRYGKIFYVYKYRTMKTTNVDFSVDAPVISNGNDNLTRFGKFLRRSKIDELPQLLNVLKGDMSIVGPRPLMSHYINVYETWEYRKFELRPGITGLGQVYGNGYLNTAERSYYDVYYVQHVSLWNDITILLRTVTVVLSGEKRTRNRVSQSEINDFRVKFNNNPRCSAIAQTAANENAMLKHLPLDTSGVKIRIAQVVGNTENNGGVPACILNYYREIDRNKFQFDFYTYAPSPIDDEITALGGNVYYIPNFINFPKAMYVFARQLKINDYFAVHANLSTLSVFPLFVAKLMGVKHRICHVHSTTHKDEKERVVKKLLRPFATLFATDYAACSQYSANWMFGKKANQAAIIYNAIKLNNFNTNPLIRKNTREALRCGGGFVIGTVGRYEYQKNQVFLLKAFALLLKKLPTAYLVLVGSGKLETHLKSKAADLNISQNVIFASPTAKIQKYYNAFDAFALPSRYEGLPIVGVEAQAMGLKCFFSDQITSEVDISGYSTFLPIDEPQVWANAFYNYAQDPTNCACREKIKDGEYNIDTAAKQLEAFYCSMLNSDKRL